MKLSLFCVLFVAFFLTTESINCTTAIERCDKKHKNSVIKYKRCLKFFCIRETCTYDELRTIQKNETTYSTMGKRCNNPNFFRSTDAECSAQIKGCRAELGANDPKNYTLNCQNFWCVRDVCSLAQIKKLDEQILTLANEALAEKLCNTSASKLSLVFIVMSIFVMLL